MKQASAIEVREAGELALTEQVVRLQALLEASRAVHSTIQVADVLGQAARVAVLELELDGAFFTTPYVAFGSVAEGVAACIGCPRFALHARDGGLLSELVVMAPGGQDLTLYEQDFLEGLVQQTAVALENAINHKRHVEYARVEQDLDAARSIQQSLLPQTMPSIAGYTLAARSRACYQVGGDYLDVVAEANGSYLFVVSDVAGKGLASALVCTAFRSAFRALATQGLPLVELAARLSEQHWEEGTEARRRYVTAVFIRLTAETGDLEVVNAGHNPAFVVPSTGDTHLLRAGGAPLGMLPGMTYEAEFLPVQAGGKVLLYTDGLTELASGDEEFGEGRLMDAFESARGDAESMLEHLWLRLDEFSKGDAQRDDMSAVVLRREDSNVEAGG